MKMLLLIVALLCQFSCASSLQTSVDPTTLEEETPTRSDASKLKEDLNEILGDLARDYAYLEDKGVSMDCLREVYGARILAVESETDSVLFFEHLLDEFYDSHLILNTNRQASYRLFSPIYADFVDGRWVVSSIWQTQVDGLDQNILGAELVEMNGVDFDAAIEAFPTLCSDKDDPMVRAWIGNKILAGRYDQPRVLTLKLANGTTTEYDLDGLKIRSDTELLTARLEGDIGILRINNSLGDNQLISAFDAALDDFMTTKGLILDLRNTVDGGNSYVARGIMGRFISEPHPYQKHWAIEQYDDGPDIERSWTESVSPRGVTYTQPVVVLVGRWTGSMGEGLAIGFDGVNRGRIVGSEMERLAGEVSGYGFLHRDYGYQISTAKLFHVDGTPREFYVPTHYVVQTTIATDEVLAEGFKHLEEMARSGSSQNGR